MRVLKYQVFNTSRNMQNTSTFYFEPRLVITTSRLSFLPPPAQPHFLALLKSHKTSLITGTDIQVIFMAEEKKKSAFFCTAP